MTAAAKPTWSDRFGANHNQRRQKRYAEDPDYRESHVKNSRESYREAHGVELFSCADRIPDAKSYCSARTLRFDGSDKVYADRLCFTMAEFATIVGDHKPPVIYRWQSRGLLPNPIAMANVWVESGGRGGSYWQEQAVYTFEEAVAMLGPISAHQSTLRYYRITDVETIEAVRLACIVARKG